MKNIKLYLMLGGVGLAVILGGILLTTVGKVVGQYFFGRGFAEGELRSYVASVNKQEINGAKCQAMDTDDNGYVSCDYTTVNDPNTVHSLECAAWGLDGFLNRGCKSRQIPR